MMVKTTFFQKVFLFFFALSVTFLILEGGLRLGGWFYLARQEEANRKHGYSSGPVGEYRILCLGESTTALGGTDAYPRQLERILNSRQNTIQFKVINKGVPATTTDQILARVDGYFRDYQPQMIIAMMGINDPESQSEWTWRDEWSRYSKAFKLFDMIVRHLSAKKKNVSSDFVEQQIAKLEEQVVKNPSLRISAELAKANLYRSANRPEEEQLSISRVLALDPENSEAWFLFGIHYDRQAEYQKALDAYRQADRKAGPEMKVKILDRMAQCYNFLGDQQAAIQIYRALLKQWPSHPEATGVLANIFLEQQNYQEAINYFVRQIAIDPQNADYYDKLAHCYRKIGQPDQAQKILDQYEGRENGKIKGLTNQEYAKVNSKTRENYLKLIKIAGQHQVPVLAMQYPNRAVAPLKKMLSSASGIHFVDNQKVFNDAVKAHSYDEIFTDHFAGDFGHCSAQGNALLAGNIADHVLKVLVKK